MGKRFAHSNYDVIRFTERAGAEKARFGLPFWVVTARQGTRHSWFVVGGGTMRTLEISPLRLRGACKIVLSPRHDDRGYFMRVWDEQIMRDHGLSASWVQENQSVSNRKGIIRGLHFQKPPHTETKLVRVVVGAILDVFVDLRKGSDSYGQWDALELSAENHTMAYIPSGFAHGFCTLTEKTAVLYKVDAYYAPDFEGGLRWDDETLKIRWPIGEPFVSARDRALPSFREFVSPF